MPIPAPIRRAQRERVILDLRDTDLGRRSNRSDRRHGLSYDNRGAEPHRPWPHPHRVRPTTPRWMFLLIGALLALVGLALYEGAQACDTVAGNVRACVD